MQETGIGGGTGRYFVLAWVAPDVGQDFLNWLRDRHIQEVVDQPGMLWAEHIGLDQCNAEGWRGHLICYGALDQLALDGYLASPARERFVAEGKAFPGVKMERLDGQSIGQWMAR